MEVGGQSRSTAPGRPARLSQPRVETPKEEAVRGKRESGAQGEPPVHERQGQEHGRAQQHLLGQSDEPLGHGSLKGSSIADKADEETTWTARPDLVER